MSKPSREEIEIEWTKNWYKHQVLDELKTKLNPIAQKKAQLYYEENKYKIRLKNKQLIYVMINFDRIMKEESRVKKLIYNREYRAKKNNQQITS